MLDVYYWEDVFLCHGACDIGSAYVDVLSLFADFLLEHPDEVITFIFESYIEAADHQAAFEMSGLIELTYAHLNGAPWPTLAEMIDANHRIVALTDDGGGVYDWLMPVWDHAVETDWNNTDITDLDCRRGRGSDENPLFILNHFAGSPPLDVWPPSQGCESESFFRDRACVRGCTGTTP